MMQTIRIQYKSLPPDLVLARRKLEDLKNEVLNLQTSLQTLPRCFKKVHPKFGTPDLLIILNILIRVNASRASRCPVSEVSLGALGGTPGSSRELNRVPRVPVITVC